MGFNKSAFDDIRKKADLVRGIDLKSVLLSTGAVRDKYDKNKWHTPRGAISVTGQKFMNWNQGTGGGGAIDLAIHLKGVDFITAVLWLWERFPGPLFRAPICKANSRRPFKLPGRYDANLPRVTGYLTKERCIASSLIRSLVESYHIYADVRANAVFPLLGKGKRAVGAELRGTSRILWKGMAPGSRKDLGYFSVQLSSGKKIVLCESAIDALSCLSLHPDCLAISTSGATPNPPWLKSLVGQGYDIYCGFDADETGDRFAEKMCGLYPNIRRLRPCKHDWNDVLISRVR